VAAPAKRLMAELSVIERFARQATELQLIDWVLIVPSAALLEWKERVVMQRSTLKLSREANS
jgi:hypothetical protein